MSEAIEHQITPETVTSQIPSISTIDQAVEASVIKNEKGDSSGNDRFNEDNIKNADDEDLLGYDSDAEVVVDDEERADYNDGTDVVLEDDDDGADSIIDIVSDSEVQEAARQLLRSKPPKITVEYQGEEYLLFQEYDGDNAAGDNPRVAICCDSADLHRGCDVLMARIRSFLQGIYGTIGFAAREIVLDIPDLELTINEDNRYSKDITMNDIVSIFKILKDNSIKRFEQDVPAYIKSEIKTNPRFVSRYNMLVEMVNSDATFSNTKAFSNDKCNPLVVDDGDKVINNASINGEPEVIVMTDDESDIGGAPLTKMQNSESDSDEILEIVDGEESLEDNLTATDAISSAFQPNTYKLNIRDQEEDKPSNQDTEGQLEDESFIETLKRKREHTTELEKH